jgi:thioredoxin 1
MEILVKSLSHEAFIKAITDDKPVLVDFFATWCEPCNYLDEILKELEIRLNGKAKIVKLDVDIHPELKAHYSIMSVPTLMIFKSGELLWRMPGFMLTGEMEKKVLEFV